MGFRTNLLSTNTGLRTPQWFLDKYNEKTNGYIGLNFLGECFTFSMLMERKFYQPLSETEFFLDVQKVLKELKYEYTYTIILLHECEGITKVEITRDTIIGMEPSNWEITDQVEHDYCDGCSDSERFINPTKSAPRRNNL